MSIPKKSIVELYGSSGGKDASTKAGSEHNELVEAMLVERAASDPITKDRIQYEIKLLGALQRKRLRKERLAEIAKCRQVYVPLPDPKRNIQACRRPPLLAMSIDQVSSLLADYGLCCKPGIGAGFRFKGQFWSPKKRRDEEDTGSSMEGKHTTVQFNSKMTVEDWNSKVSARQSGWDARRKLETESWERRRDLEEEIWIRLGKKDEPGWNERRQLQEEQWFFKRLYEEKQFQKRKALQNKLFFENQFA